MTIIAKHEEEEQKGQDEKDSSKQGIIDDLKGEIISSIVLVLAMDRDWKRTLQRAGNSANIASADANTLKCQEDAAE